MLLKSFISVLLSIKNRLSTVLRRTITQIILKETIPGRIVTLQAFTIHKSLFNPGETKKGERGGLAPHSAKHPGP
jgi:hypothetical protein